MSINEQPLVTVYIPTFNRLELLQRAVESVCNQTYKNLEIIVVDDCSTDGTQKYLAQLAKEDSRVRYFLKEKNSGACVSRNIAIENATGEFITGLDDDDYFEIDRIQIFTSNKGLLKKYAFLYSNYSIINTRGIFKSKADIFKPKTIKYRDLLSNNYINNQIFVKTSVLKENYFNKNMPARQDIYTWYKILNKSKKEGFLIRDYSYVMDVSHPHERISMKKIEKIEYAYSIFCNDFKLSFYKRKVLKNQFYHYDRIKVDKIDIVFSIFNSPNLYNIIVCFYKFFGKNGT